MTWRLRGTASGLWINMAACKFDGNNMLKMVGVFTPDQSPGTVLLLRPPSLAKNVPLNRKTVSTLSKSQYIPELSLDVSAVHRLRFYCTLTHRI